MVRPVPPVIATLRELIAKNSVKVCDVFREWDEDSNGLVSRVEFRRGIVALGLSKNGKDIDKVFDTFDKDGSGSLDYKELNAVLRPSQVGPSNAKSATKKSGRAQGARQPD